MGACPKCSAKVYEHGSGYICEKAVGAARTCDFRSGRIILQQEITREQMGKLLTGGRTDLLTDFVSNRSRRKFKAFLVKQPDGKVGFEFMQRAVKPGGEKEPPAKAATPKKSAVTKPSAEEPTSSKPVAKKAVKKAATKSAVKKATKKPVKKVTRGAK